MKKATASVKELTGSANRVVGTRSAAKTAISNAELDAIFRDVGQKLREGRSREAERILVDTIQSFQHSPDNLAHLKRLLSFTLETAGRYKESLEAVRQFENEESIGELAIETQIRVTTQLAISYNNLTDQPKAVTLLKETLQKAEDHDLGRLAGSIHIGLARVYRKLSEYPISRGFAYNALDHFRDDGNWLGMAEAYREIANTYHQEGNSEKSLENFELGIQIIGNNSAPFMLGKLYTDMSGAYWFLRRPKDGVACLEKSIEFFDQTEHALNTVIAYNNLGINLMLIGKWEKAERMIRQALAIADVEDHVHIAGVYDSLGELMILRGQVSEAEQTLQLAVSIAKRRKHQWYTVQAMRNLARCYLAQGKTSKAIATAIETIELSHEMGDKHYANMAGLVLAESYLRQGDVEECEAALKTIEESDPNKDFFVLGNIQRIRGLAALEDEDAELAVHHFSRALTIFEAAEDVYHTGIAHFLLGSNLDLQNAVRAKRHLTSAADIFKHLGTRALLEATNTEFARLETAAAIKASSPSERRTNSVVSQLLTVRLAEATASRELLFRELVAVLQQESNATKIIIAQKNDQKRLYPFITHGYSPQESNDLVTKFGQARDRSEEKAFIRSKNVAVFDLHGSGSPPGA